MKRIKNESKAKERKRNGGNKKGMKKIEEE